MVSKRIFVVILLQINFKLSFLSFFFSEISEEEVRSHFVSCGKIESVRIIRHRKTGLSRGVGYINFEEEDSVPLALELNNTKIKAREIRVKPYSPDAKAKKRRHLDNKKGVQKNFQKKFKNDQGKPVAVKVSVNNTYKFYTVFICNTNFCWYLKNISITIIFLIFQNEKEQNNQKQLKDKVKKEKPTDSHSPNSSPIKKEKKSSFQGKKADAKKKQKINKLDKKKKIVAEKLTSIKKPPKSTD